MLYAIKKSYNGSFVINNKLVSFDDLVSSIKQAPANTPISFQLRQSRQDLLGEGAPVSVHHVGDNTVYEITVKSYMTKPATASFDFMLKYNHNIPMPSTVMTGRKISQTKGMLEMDLYDANGTHWKGYVIKSAIINEKVVSN